MSHCLIVKSGDDVFIGADTATSSKFMGKQYRADVTMEKIVHVEDFLVFVSGEYSASNELVRTIQSITPLSLYDITHMTKTLYKDSTGHSEVVVVDNKLNVHSISSFNNFEAVQLEEYDGINIWSAGIKTSEGVKECVSQIENGNVQIQSIYKNVFDSISDETIGGKLHVFHASKNGVNKLLESDIKEKRVRHVDEAFGGNMKLSLVVAERLIGKAIIGEKLEIGDEEGTFTMRGNLLTVQDRNDIVRLRLGEYVSDKFGLQLMNKTGKEVVLDENGILQTWQQGGADNVDQKHGLTLNIYLPSDTLSIRQALLRFMILPFRSYSGTTESGGASINTSKDGGAISTSTKSGGSTTITSSSGGSVNKSTASGGSYVNSTANGGGYVNSTASGGGYQDTTADGGFATVTDVTDIATGSGTGHVHQFTIGAAKFIHDHKINIPNHTHGINIPNHSHGINIPNHTHNFTVPNHTHSVKVPAHTHDFTIPNHSHVVEVPPHKHDIDHGIYVSTFAKGVGVIINDIDRSNQLGGKFDSSQASLDIAEYLKIGQWNEITLTSERLGRIDSTVFIQAMLAT